MKRISLDDLLHTRQDLDYQEQYEYIMKLLEKGQIKPVKASKSNGKKPALYREYWMVEEQKDYSNYIEEIKYTFSTMISVDYYLAHPDTYEKDRIWVLMLNEYLKKHADALLTAESLNERSFEIWHREKFLDREQGKKILKRCGLNVEALNVYRTTEPLSYYTHTRNTPQTPTFRNKIILGGTDNFAASTVIAPITIHPITLIQKVFTGKIMVSPVGISPIRYRNTAPAKPPSPTAKQFIILSLQNQADKFIRFATRLYTE